MKYLDEAYEYIMQINSGVNPDTYLQNFSNKNQLEIMMSAKKLLVYAAISEGADMQGACYDCRYRGSVPGDTHSCCKNPLAFAVGNEHGVSHGWFLHPLNFDPVWPRFCDGYEEKTIKRR